MTYLVSAGGQPAFMLEPPLPTNRRHVYSHAHHLGHPDPAGDGA